MRVFLDTNVLVSAVATRGLCADVLREILVSHQLVVSSPLIAELKNILHTKIGIPQEIISDFIEVLNQDSILSENTKLTTIDINDKDDILILSTALNGNAELFVTGDKELLELGKIQSLEIMSPRLFWETLKTRTID
ncbi:MAG: putative toxin-antitoxin system toxin component, PIN family [Thermodesulfobacteriota bacterium]|nr:putative toxin-antitoxin system toxin component, PIN family [Thermodesulfobacteriota bacterium]